MRKYTQAPPASPSKACAVENCAGAGDYKAPLSRDKLHDYQWLCLDHVKEFNRAWDYFNGMDTAQIEAFRQDSLTGHRPTWQRESHVNGKKNYSTRLEEEIHEFIHWGTRAKTPAHPPIPPKEKRALKTLGLSQPCDVPTLKKHYRTLVKNHHPDLHQGDRAQEEIFKEIAVAYNYLLAHYTKTAT